MVFVEILRLIMVVGGALVGLSIAGNDSSSGRVLGATIGVLVAYVIGGAAGRLLERVSQKANRRWRDVPATEILAGAVLGGVGLLVGVVFCIPLFVFVKQDYDYPIAAAASWVVGYLGLRVGMSKGRQLSDAARLSRRLSIGDDDVKPGAVMVDTSAVMDRAFLVLGRAGLLGNEILVPEPVADELATLAEAPDPVASRRARRGLEALEVIRQAGVTVTVVAGDVPSASMTEEKVLALADRMGCRIVTSSADVARQQASLNVPILDIRALLVDLAPDHIPGERLRVDLVRAGKQPRQAVGYLPDGDMVVVNDAAHRIGEDAVEISVLSTRPTTQGLIVFGQAIDDDWDADQPSRVTGA
ncbi:MAG: hypothetical protein ABSH30_09990 [Acidimicrobiales bacterium]|jgi:uncharacterized protein YacL